MIGPLGHFTNKLLSGRDRVDTNIDPSAHCMVFSDDVRSNRECYADA
jgi:hypothetical protein